MLTIAFVASWDFGIWRKILVREGGSVLLFPIIRLESLFSIHFSSSSTLIGLQCIHLSEKNGEFVLYFLRNLRSIQANWRYVQICK